MRSHSKIPGRQELGGGWGVGRGETLVIPVQAPRNNHMNSGRDLLKLQPEVEFWQRESQNSLEGTLMGLQTLTEPLVSETRLHAIRMEFQVPVDPAPLQLINRLKILL